MRELNQNFLLALCLSFFVVLVIGILPEQFNGRGYDYQFHLDKTRGEPKSSDRDTHWYAPLFHLLATPFIFNEKPFYLFALFLIGIITPMLLVWQSKNWVSALFFFTTTEYFWFLEQGVYPQALVGIFVLIVLIVKDWRIRLPVLLLATLTHSYGFFALGLTLMVLALHESGILTKKNIFLGCSGLFGSARPDKLMDTRLVEYVNPKIDTTLTHQEMNGFRISFVLKFLFQIYPLIFLYWSLKYLLKYKRLDLVILTIAFIILGFVDNYRIWYFIPLFCIYGLTKFYENLKYAGFWQQKAFLVFVLVYGLIQFFVWFNYKWQCFPVV